MLAVYRFDTTFVGYKTASSSSFFRSPPEPNPPHSCPPTPPPPFPLLLRSRPAHPNARRLPYIPRCLATWTRLLRERPRVRNGSERRSRMHWPRSRRLTRRHLPKGFNKKHRIFSCLCTSQASPSTRRRSGTASTRCLSRCVCVCLCTCACVCFVKKMRFYFHYVTYYLRTPHTNLSKTENRNDCAHTMSFLLLSQHFLHRNACIITYSLLITQ